MEAIQQIESSGVIYDRIGLREFVLVYGGEELATLLDRSREDLLDRIIGEIIQGEPDQPPLLIMARVKGQAVYPPRHVATALQRNGYLHRQNRTLVNLREKAKLVRDEMDLLGLHPDELFIVARALEDECGEEIRAQPMTKARFQLLFPEWEAEGQFGDDGTDEEE
jgi:hypothetical protein